MSSKQEKLNSQFVEYLGFYLSKNIHIKDALVTVKEINLSTNLSQAVVKVSVLPINLSGSALTVLRKSSKESSQFVSRKLKLRKVPKLIWSIDSSEEKFAQMNKLFDQINKEEK